MFQSVIRVMADNSMKQMEVLDRVATNVSNINTNGYKALRFEQYLMPDGRIEATPRVDTSQGSLFITKHPLDVGIQGPGYIPVTQANGEVAYTRDGSLTVNKEGYLVTHRGDMVGDGIQIPANYDKLQILETGVVQVLQNKDGQPIVLGKITLANFNNPEGLQDVSNNRLLPTPESGPPIQAPAGTLLKQGMVERANVSVYGQIDQILRLNASVISGYRVIKFTDDLYRQAVNLKQ
jgi:flagellar basal-body rod protein FlgG